MVLSKSSRISSCEMGSLFPSELTLLLAGSSILGILSCCFHATTNFSSLPCIHCGFSDGKHVDITFYLHISH